MPENGVDRQSGMSLPTLLIDTNFDHLNGLFGLN